MTSTLPTDQAQAGAPREAPDPASPASGNGQAPPGADDAHRGSQRLSGVEVLEPGSALVVPDPRSEMYPVGWGLEVAGPVIEATDSWDLLERWEALLRVVDDYVGALGPVAFEVRVALRLIDKRRGELLGPARPGTRTDLRPPVAGGYDVPERTAHRYRLIAEHWDDVIRPALSSAARDGKPALATQTHCLALIREHTPARPDASPPDSEAGDDRVRLLHGDFRERLSVLEDHSVDLIVTDPPYKTEALPLYSALSEHAARLLGPRGILFCWSGQMFLPEILARLGEHLRYGWCFALQEPGSRVMGRHITQGWRPVLAFTPGTWPSGEWGADWLASPESDKTDYAWQQSAAPARQLIERFSPPDGLVVDPLMGVGSFGRAAREVGRRFVGVELDAGRFARAETLVLAGA